MLRTLPITVVLLVVGCGDERVEATTEAASGPAASGFGVGAGGDGGADGGGAAGPSDGGGGDHGWRTLPPLPAGPRQQHAVVARAGEVWTLGGLDAVGIPTDRVEIFDPDEDAWRPGPDLPLPMVDANVAVVGRRLFVLGFLEGLAAAASPDAWELDVDEGLWSPRSALPGERARGAAAVAVVGDRVVVCGGLRASAVAECDLYDTIDDAWTPLPDLPAARDHAAGATIDGRVLVVGGRETAIRAVAGEVWELSSGLDAWLPRAPMRTPRAGAAATVLGDRLFVAGGEGDPDGPRGVFEELEVYDGDADAWSSLAPMPTPRHGAGAAAVDGLVVVPGGAEAEGLAPLDVVEAYRP